MTVQETILSFPGLGDFPPVHLSAILDSRAISGATDSSEVNVKQINLAIADALVFAVNLPDFTENKLSISYPRDYFIQTAKLLYTASGEPEKAQALGREITVPRGRATNIW